MLLNSLVLGAKNRPALGAILQQTSSNGKESAEVGHPQQREWIEGGLQEKVGQTRRGPVDLRLVREDEVDVRVVVDVADKDPQGHGIKHTILVGDQEVIAGRFLDRQVPRPAWSQGAFKAFERDPPVPVRPALSYL